MTIPKPLTRMHLTLARVKCSQHIQSAWVLHLTSQSSIMRFWILQTRLANWLNRLIKQQTKQSKAKQSEAGQMQSAITRDKPFQLNNFKWNYVIYIYHIPYYDIELIVNNDCILFFFFVSFVLWYPLHSTTFNNSNQMWLRTRKKLIKRHSILQKLKCSQHIQSD